MTYQIFDHINNNNHKNNNHHPNIIRINIIFNFFRFGGRLDEYCIECHERMARWHIMCHHQLQWSGNNFSYFINYSIFICKFEMILLTTIDHIVDYLTTHSYTNNEQLNKLMKTLNELYDEAHLRERRSREGNINHDDEKSVIIPIPNEGELRSYYVLYQLDNEGEVEKYLQKLCPDALNHPSMQFAIKVRKFI